MPENISYLISVLIVTVVATLGLLLFQHLRRSMLLPVAIVELQVKAQVNEEALILTKVLAADAIGRQLSLLVQDTDAVLTMVSEPSEGKLEAMSCLAPGDFLALTEMYGQGTKRRIWRWESPSGENVDWTLSLNVDAYRLLAQQESVSSLEGDPARLKTTSASPSYSTSSNH